MCKFYAKCKLIISLLSSLMNTTRCQESNQHSSVQQVGSKQWAKSSPMAEEASAAITRHLCLLL